MNITDSDVYVLDVSIVIMCIVCIEMVVQAPNGVSKFFAVVQSYFWQI